MLGLPDGTQVLLPNGTVFEVSDGTMLITDYE
jgi:hypothetical protein